ncbi:MAG: hypothetical protein OXG44_03175 [Gammaproteobacteria bacterium]|nr:hypothetical protein [Gammaproteobacteria bacterium]
MPTYRSSLILRDAGDHTVDGPLVGIDGKGLEQPFILGRSVLASSKLLIDTTTGLIALNIYD